MVDRTNWDALEERLYRLASPDAPLGLAFLKTVIKELGASCDFPAVHIAGTNGKGSTSACCDAILRAQGYSTALFTSPHLACVGERLLIDGKMLLPEEWHAAFDKIECVLARHPEIRLCFFSVLVAAAFLLISEHSPDVAVLETGLGGTYDGTNVIEKPLISVITPIGLDHTAILGSTVEEIAESKFGIIKRGCKALYCGSPCGLNGRFLEVCRDIGAVGTVFTDLCRVENAASSVDGTSFELSFGDTAEKMRVRLPGLYQARNASLAVAALRLISDSFPVSGGAVEKGLLNVLWPGRMEIVRRSPNVILDGAHNPHGTKALAESLSAFYGSEKAISFVYAAMGDKDYSNSLSMLAGSFPKARLFCCSVEGSARSESGEKLACRAKALGWKEVLAMDSAAAAIKAAIAFGEPVVVCGSLYFIGQMRGLMKGLNSI